ncbi:MAG: pyridoxamine 5'-phosphate oxidase [Planctomycetota bacterium]|nr:pyridoxamine 5'-phosphate oxidase [Planctomycetota bacterium]
MNLADIRREYSQAVLDESHVDPDPIVQFQRWLDQAFEAQETEPTAATLATATRDGAPSARIVLIKGVDARGFAFFTDYRSRKGQELEANPRAALCVLWSNLERQVRVEGRVERVSREESAAYYRTRPLGSRLGAWASRQSSEIPNRGELEERVDAVRREMGEDPPLPPHWGGFVLLPTSLEFWQGRESRLHDRLEYQRVGAAWRIHRLSP